MLMPLQADRSLADAQIVVERRGPPSRSWWWKLVRDERPLIEGRHAYRGAEEAYEAARAELRREAGAPIAMGRPAALFGD